MLTKAMSSITAVASKYLPQKKLQEIIESMEKYTDMTERERAENEARVFNQSEGSLNDDGYNCPKCRNKGSIYRTVERKDPFGKPVWEVIASNCDCLKIRQEMQVAENSGLSLLMKEKTFENFKVTEKWQSNLKYDALCYVEHPDGWFFVGGQPGCGKTHICTAMMGALIKNGKVAKYSIWLTDITKLKQLITEYEKYEAALRQFKTAEVLYIDDFFKTRSKESVSVADVARTFDIINYRYNKRLPTIISSELSANEIVNIDEGLGSRIIEMCNKSREPIYIDPDESRNYRIHGGENTK